MRLSEAMRGSILAILCLALQGCMYAKPFDSDIREFEAEHPRVCGKPIASFERYYAYDIGDEGWVDFATIVATLVPDASAKAHPYSVVRPPELPAWLDGPPIVYLRLDRKTGAVEIVGCADVDAAFATKA